MPEVTNLTKSPIDFIVGIKDGVAVTERVLPEQTRNIGVDVNSVKVRALVHAKAISVSGGVALTGRPVAEISAPPTNLIRRAAGRRSRSVPE